MTYFTEEKPLPKKFQNSQFKFKGGRLWDNILKEFVIKNPGKIRYQTLNGNQLMRAHPQVWFKCFDELKNHFMVVIKQEMNRTGIKQFAYPIVVDLLMSGPFGTANWDIDGMWFYHKCLLDAIRDLGLVFDDNIINVRGAGGTIFVPCTIDTVPELVINIVEVAPDDHHLFDKGEIHLIESRVITPGEVRAEMIGGSLGMVLHVGVGKKKILFGKANIGMRRAAQYCLDYLYSASISKEMYHNYMDFLGRFTECRIPLRIK